MSNSGFLHTNANEFYRRVYQWTVDNDSEGMNSKHVQLEHNMCKHDQRVPRRRCPRVQRRPALLPLPKNDRGI